MESDASHVCKCTLAVHFETQGLIGSSQKTQAADRIILLWPLQLYSREIYPGSTECHPSPRAAAGELETRRTHPSV